MITFGTKGKIRGRAKGLLVGALVLIIVVCAVAGARMTQRDPLYASRTLKENEIQVHFIDVGQGDATLIRTPGGNLLIDAGTGESEDSLLAYLDYLDIETIHYAVFTHPDEDHIGGADMILRQYRVEQVILPRVEDDSRVHATMMDAIEEESCPILWATPNTTFRLGGATFTILAPLSSEAGESNNRSVVLRMDYGETSALFMGDAELSAEEELVARYGASAGGLLDCDLIKVGHHGSDTSSGQALLRAVTPDFGVISCGAGNAHGHPSPSVLRAYEAMGTVIFRTDVDGSIIFRSTGGEPAVS